MRRLPPKMAGECAKTEKRRIPLPRLRPENGWKEMAYIHTQRGPLRRRPFRGERAGLALKACIAHESPRREAAELDRDEVVRH